MSDLSVQSLSGTPTAGEMSVSEGDASSDIGLGEKPRRKRTVITPDQLDKLETSFKQEPWPHRSRKENIAKDLDKPEPFVSIWFQNKRARVKREEEMAKQGLQHDQKVKGSYSDENKAPPPVLGFPDDSLPKKRIISVEDNKGNRYVKLLEICKPEDNFRDIVSRSLIEQRESQRSPVNINLSEKSVSKEVSHCGGGEGGAVTTKVSWSVPVAMTETSAGGGRTGSTSRPTTSSSTSTSSSSSRPTSSSTTSSGTTTSCNVASRPAPAVAVKHRSTTDQAAKVSYTHGRIGGSGPPPFLFLPTM